MSRDERYEQIKAIADETLASAPSSLGVAAASALVITKVCQFYEDLLPDDARVCLLWVPSDREDLAAWTAWHNEIERPLKEAFERANGEDPNAWDQNIDAVLAAMQVYDRKNLWGQDYIGDRNLATARHIRHRSYEWNEVLG